MTDSVAGRIVVLAVLIAALVSALANILLKGVLGVAVFGIADIPWSVFLPDFHNDFLQGIGTTFGLFWFLLMAGIFIVAANRRVPEKWDKSPMAYRAVLLLLSTAVISVILTLPFHLYGLWMTHRDYGV